MSEQIKKANKLVSKSQGKERKLTIKTKAIDEPKVRGVHKDKGIVRWLGGSVLVDHEIQTDFDIIKVGTSGIYKASIDALTSFIGVTRKSMAEEILNVSIKTLERKQPKDTLDVKTSSHAMEVAKVMQHAFEVFEEEEKVRRWLNRENKALGGAKPVKLLNTLTGINMVNDILSRIEEGVYS